MMFLGNVPAGSTLYVPFATYNAAGASVTITGLATTDIEIYKNGSVTQRSSDAGYALLDTDGIDFDGVTGIHGFSIDLSDNTDAGFYSAGATYWLVVASITADSQTVNALFYFTIDKAPAANVTQWLGTAAATPTVAGVPEVDVTHFNGTAGTFASGRPEVNTSHFAGTSLATLTGAYPALGIAESGTMQSGSAADTAVLRSATSFANDNPIGYQIWIYGGTGIGQTRFIEDWVSASDTATVSQDWLVTPDNTSTYIVYPTAAGTADSNIAAILADTNELQTDWANGGRLDLIVDAILVDTGTTLDGRIPAALVSGRMDASVGAMAANVMTAAAAAADLTTELQNGLATAAALATVDTVVDAIQVQTDKFANLPVLTAGGTGGQGYGAP